jgi:hypothetical protein
MQILKDIIQLLTFRLNREAMLHFNYKHLLVGVIGTWIVGMGRYWDDPGAKVLQHLGLGSVIYIFVLSAFIWLIVLPFKVEQWSYKTVLTFISLTSFPAIFYAIPVERYYSLELANLINVRFLAVVALWRLLLLFFFLSRFTRLSQGNIFTITLMPICLIIATLTILNLHRVVFNIMGGNRNPTAHDSSYTVLFVLTLISELLVLPLIAAYLVGIYNRRKMKT